MRFIDTTCKICGCGWSEILQKKKKKKKMAAPNEIMKLALLAYVMYTVAGSDSDTFFVNGLQYGIGYWFASYAIDIATGTSQ